VDILMPQLGETVSEGKITAWLKAVGDAVKPGDNLFEVETDKTSMEVPATSAGVIAEIRVAAGVVAPVGAVVAVISGQGASTAAPAAIKTASPPQAAARAIALDPFNEVRTQTRNHRRPARPAPSSQTTQHLYLRAEIAVGRLMEARDEANAGASKNKDGEPAFRLSFDDFIIKAWAAALQRVPAANAIWTNGRITRLEHSDIGVALAFEGQAVTPVIRQAEQKSLTAISAELKDLATRARERGLTPQDYAGGSTAISSLAAQGVSEFAAVINPPHATLLAIGAMQRRQVETKDNSLRFADVMTVTLACDPRVMEAALGAELLDAFKSFSENPLTALI
jgi:pyruvate dehydrogenase E2 component (dihydrolipoamide acetyltransferase)